MLKILVVVALLFGAPAALSQAVSSCPTATPGTVWSKGAWLPCATTVTYIAQPVAMTALVSDMRCPIAPATGACVFSWQLGRKVLPSDRVWLKDTAFPNGTWVRASALRFASTPSPPCMTLLYVGAPFSMVSVTGPNAQVVKSPVIALFTFAVPLRANAVNVPVLPMAWDLSLENSELKSTNPFFGLFPVSTFKFTTDDGGKIIGWDIDVTWDSSFESGPENEHGIGVFLTDTGDSVSLFYSFSAEPGSTNPTSITGSNTTKGTWTCLRSFTSKFP